MSSRRSRFSLEIPLGSGKCAALIVPPMQGTLAWLGRRSATWDNDNKTFWITRATRRTDCLRARSCGSDGHSWCSMRPKSSAPAPDNVTSDARTHAAMTAPAAAWGPTMVAGPEGGARSVIPHSYRAPAATGSSGPSHPPRSRSDACQDGVRTNIAEDAAETLGASEHNRLPAIGLLVGSVHDLVRHRSRQPRTSCSGRSTRQSDS